MLVETNNPKDSTKHGSKTVVLKIAGSETKDIEGFSLI